MVGSQDLFFFPFPSKTHLHIHSCICTNSCKYTHLHAKHPCTHMHTQNSHTQSHMPTVLIYMNACKCQGWRQMKVVAFYTTVHRRMLERWHCGIEETCIQKSKTWFLFHWVALQCVMFNWQILNPPGQPSSPARWRCGRWWNPLVTGTVWQTRTKALGSGRHGCKLHLHPSLVHSCGSPAVSWVQWRTQLHGSLWRLNEIQKHT